MSKKTKVYLVIAFSWTWIGWIGSYWISNLNGDILSTDGTIFTLWTDFWGSTGFLPQLIFTIAVYGPFIGFLVTSSFKKLHSNVQIRMNFWHYVILVPLISVIPAFILSLSTSLYDIKGLSIGAALTSILIYFASNLVTSGTEEFGWRGFLYPEMKAEGMSFWDIAWKGGFVWALWHFPILFILYMPQGYAVLIPSLAGFTASIVAMNYITNFLYEVMHNIWAVVLLHALNNTMSFALVLLFPGTPFTILSSLMAWGIVWWIEKKHADKITSVSYK